MRIRRLDNKMISVLLLCFMFIYVIIYRFVILNNYLKYEEFITSSFFIVLTFITVTLLGFRVNKIERINDSKIVLLISMILLYFSIIYFIGFFKGFLQNSYSLRLKHVFYNIICPLINLVCLEIIRYVLMWSNKKNKSFFMICLISFTLLEVFFNFNFYNINKLEGIFKLICLLILRSFMDNLLLCYMSINVGLKSCIVYKAFTTLYLYLIPIIPDLGTLIETIINILFPFILWLYFYRIKTEEDNIVFNDMKKKDNKLLNNIMFTTCLIFMALVIGILPVKLLTIVSQSMYPKIQIGDVVIVNTLQDKDKIKEGDVIAFKQDGIIIVHRVYEINNDTGTYITKGDNNNDVDNFKIYDDDVMGKVLFSVPYLGYPSIYFTKLIGGN